MSSTSAMKTIKTKKTRKTGGMRTGEQDEKEIESIDCQKRIIFADSNMRKGFVHNEYLCNYIIVTFLNTKLVNFRED